MLGMERWVDPRIKSVKVADMQRYLLSHGWKGKPFPRPQLLVFEGPRFGGEKVIQVLPSSEELADYQQRLLELITALAVIEDGGWASSFPG